MASECLLVVTSRAVLLRYDFSMGSNPGAGWEHAGAQLQASHTRALQQFIHQQ